ncbi:transposase [Kitasatospora griseola]|uniref:transposase n=1 Tax=Kitasatospora griseola TaxID=2064 RepID=UPI0016709045|nr:transposase [Kitasatospora griseola]
MLDDLVPDDLRERVAPLLPPHPPRRRRYPGRLPADDRAAFRGIVYVLCKGVSRRDVPAERTGCSGVTAWRQLRDWTEAGLWPRLHEVLLAELRMAGLLELDDAAIDGSHVFADRGYDYDKYRRILRRRGITPRIARRGVAHGSGLGKTRWVVERTFAWLHQFKRLRIRYEIRADLHESLLQLACSIICLRRLRTSF